MIGQTMIRYNSLFGFLERTTVCSLRPQSSSAWRLALMILKVQFEAAHFVFSIIKSSSIILETRFSFSELIKVFMATVAGSHCLFCTDNNLLTAKGKREHASYDSIALPIKRNITEIMLEASMLLRKQKGLKSPSIYRSSQKEKYCIVTKAMRSTVQHLNSLNSYLGKLHDDVKKPSSKTLNEMTESVAEIDEFKAENGLRSLGNYLDKVKDVESENYIDKDIQALANTFEKKERGSPRERSLKIFMELNPENAEGTGKSNDKASDFYLISVLASINIAVFLFEMAAPVKGSNLELFSLPMVYGAKINNLILTGEWWRLVTPMFLHWGILHVAIGSWGLFSFGLEVSQEYGSFTFLLIYVLGGISANFISFLHTTEPTVGGTGPVFAIIGAWLIYQVQNKDVIVKTTYERLFRLAIITIALICVLSNYGPIDDWAHFGATFTGIAYGLVTCPSIQVKDASSQAGGRQERITLVQGFPDPCKSLLYFSLFILLLICLLFVIEPPLELI